MAEEVTSDNSRVSRFSELYRGKNYRAALQEIDGIQLDAGADRALVLDKTRCLRVIGDLGAAQALAVQVLAQAPGDIRAILEAGLIEMDAKRYPAALEYFQRGERSTKSNVWSYIHQAELYTKLGDLPAARDALSRGAENAAAHASDVEYNNCIKQLSLVRSKLAQSNLKSVSITNERLMRNGRAVDSSLQVSMVKDEEDIIYRNLAHSYRVGIRNFVIADNGSSDGTRSEIERFARDFPIATVFIVSDPVIGYYQDAKTMGLARLGYTVFSGMGRKIDWVFALDADEFLYFADENGDLYGIIETAERQGCSLIVNYLSNVSSDKLIEHVGPETDFAADFPVIASFAVYPTSKVAFRYAPEMYLEMGNHFISNRVTSESAILVGAEHQMMMLHYPLRSLAQVRSKVLNGGAAYAKAPELSNFGGHWRRRYERYLKEGESSLVEILQDYIDKNRAIAV